MVYVFLADGFEEVEAVLPIDLMRRAGLQVSIVGVGMNPQQSIGAHNIGIATDCEIADVSISDAQALVFPGGLPGADNLAKNEKITSLIRAHMSNNGIVAAICASPGRVLGAQGFLKNRRFTCYPSNEQFAPDGHYVPQEDVVRDGNIITSKGVGTAHIFGYALIEALLGKEKAEEVRVACLIQQ